jgi:hypothetical protein
VVDSSAIAALLSSYSHLGPRHANTAIQLYRLAASQGSIDSFVVESLLYTLAARHLPQDMILAHQVLDRLC